MWIEAWSDHWWPRIYFYLKSFELIQYSAMYQNQTCTPGPSLRPLPYLNCGKLKAEIDPYVKPSTSSLLLVVNNIFKYIQVELWSSGACMY